MYDAGKVITGLIIFVIFVTFPFWFNMTNGKAIGAPEFKPIEGEKDCVEDVSFMRANHMDLLNTWRDDVVRESNRNYTSEKHGKVFNMSLSNTCLKCHKSREEFCYKCHEYAGVETYCWECHDEKRGK